MNIVQGASKILRKSDFSSDLTTCLPIIEGGAQPNIGGSTHNWGLQPIIGVGGGLGPSQKDVKLPSDP